MRTWPALMCCSNPLVGRPGGSESVAHGRRGRTYSIRLARRWQARHGRRPGRRLAYLRSDGVPGTGAASSPPPPAATSAPSLPEEACGDRVARGGVGSPRCRFGRPLRVPPVPPSGDAGEDGDEDQDRGHEDQQRPLLDEQVEHRTAAARATAHLVSSAVGGGPGSPGGVDAVIVPGGTAGSGDVRQRVADAQFERRSSGGRGASPGRCWSGPKVPPRKQGPLSVTTATGAGTWPMTKSSASTTSFSPVSAEASSRGVHRRRPAASSRPH